MFDDDKIFKQLDICLKHAINTYDDENVFGIYLTEAKQIMAIIIPTFESVCLNQELIFETIEIDESTKYRAVDIRQIYNATTKGHPELLEGLYTDYYIPNARYEHMYHKLLRANRDIISAGASQGIPAPELKIALMKIMRTAMNDNSAAVKFIKQCTDADKLALIGIINAIGDEGIFSQAKVASAIGVSRYAMTTVVAKLEVAGVAKVISLGPKGTYIKIIDDTLLNIKGE